MGSTGWMDRARQCNPGVPLWRVIWWKFLQLVCGAWLRACYRHRVHHADRIPAQGPVLLVCNHQSFLDLIVLGVSIPHRHFHSMARSTLFEGDFAGLIESLNAFPVDQESKGDLKAIRTAMDLLKQGQLVLVFPEGTRTEDGAVDEFQKGILLILRRVKPTIVPAAVEGVFDVWPIHAGRPKWRGYTAVAFGEPISSEELLARGEEVAMTDLHDQVDRLRLSLRDELRDRTGGKWPAPGPGDGLASA